MPISVGFLLWPGGDIYVSVCGLCVMVFTCLLVLTISGRTECTAGQVFTV